MKKTLISIFAALISVSLLLTGCSTKDLTKGKSPQEIVIESSAAMQKLKSYSFAMEMLMKLPNPETQTIETVSISGTGEAVQNPQKAHLEMITKLMDNEMPSEVYVEIEGDKIVEYISNPLNNEEWFKMEIPVSPEMMKMLDPAKSLEAVQELLVDAAIVDQLEEEKIKYIVIKATIKPAAIAEFIPADLPVPQEHLSQMLTSLDNISYNMWIRMDNLYTTKMEMDISDIMKSVISSQPNLPSEAKALLEQVTATMKMSYTDFDSPLTITVPDNIKNSAQDMSELMKNAPTQG